MTTVLIVDDHDLVRRGVRETLADDPLITAIGEARDGSEALALAGQWDVIVLDINMPGENGIQVLRKLKAAWPAICVIMFSFHTDPRIVQACQQAGAAGYLKKDADPVELLDAVRVVAAGGVYFSPAG